MKITKERWNQAQIAEYYELNENTDPGENAYAYAVKATFDLLDLNPKVDLKDKVVVEVKGTDPQIGGSGIGTVINYQILGDTDI